MTKQTIKEAIQKGVQNTPHPNYIKRVRLFGSYLHGKAKAESDVDLILDLEETAPVGLFEFYDIEQAFSQALERKVDMTTPDGLSKYIRDEILAEAETLYERG